MARPAARADGVDMSRTLAYRPAAVAGEERLVARLCREDLMFRVRWLGLFGLGLILLWAVPAIVSWRIHVGRAGTSGAAISWPVLLLVCSAILVPILFAIEHATRGRFLEETIDRLDVVHTPLLWRFAYAEGLGWLIVFEIFLWGPRMTLAAARRLRGASALASVSLAPAAAVLVELLRHEDGRATAEVMSDAGLSPTAFSEALAYLAFHDYVGIAKDGTRVWLNTDARQRLAFT